VTSLDKTKADAASS